MPMNRDEFFRRQSQRGRPATPQISPAQPVTAPPPRPTPVVATPPKPKPVKASRPAVRAQATKPVVRRHTPRRKTIVLISIIVALLLGGGGGAAAWFASQNTSTGREGLPKTVLQSANFTLWAPQNGQGIVPGSVKYDSQQKDVSYQLSSPIAVTVSQQATPEQFSDITDYEQKFYDNVLHQYQTLSVEQGTVHLARPTSSTDVAVLNSKNTLLFVQSDRQLSTTQWQQLFSQLVAVQN